MTKKEEEFLNRASELISDIKEYILSNEDWIYYFLNPNVGTTANEPIFEIIKDFGNEWEDYIDLEVIYVDSASVKVTIEIEDGSEEGINLNRFIYLPSFEKSVALNKKLCNIDMTEWKITNLKEEIECYRTKLELKEKELDELQKEIAK